MTALILFILGIPVGLLSSLLGIGGGIIIVPCLYFLFPHLPAQVVIASSLGMIFFSNLASLYHFFKYKIKGDLFLKIGMSCFAFLGVSLGSKLSFSLSQESLMLILSLSLFIFSIKIFLSSQKKISAQKEHPKVSLKAYFLFIFASFFAGTFAALTGLGGGMIVMPVLISLGFSMLQAGQYSNLVIAVGTLSGLIYFSLLETPLLSFPLEIFQDFQIGQINFLIILLVFPSSFLGAKMGLKYLLKANQRPLQVLLALLQLFFAIKFFPFLP